MVVGFAPSPTPFPIVVNENFGIDPCAPADIQFGPPIRHPDGRERRRAARDYFHDPAK